MIARILIVCLLLVSSSVARAQTATSADVQAKLALVGNKTVYRMGEPIKLTMEFSTDREGYTVDILPERTEPALDSIVISPESGVTHWLNEFADNRLTPRHVFAPVKLTSSPHRLEMVLNDTMRFDAAGRYSVTVTTRRVARTSTSPGESLVLTTNPVVFEIQPMSDTEEAQEIKRLSEQLDTARNTQTQQEIVSLMSYLSGDPSTREKVKRILDQERNGNAGLHFWHGLFIARNRALALKLLEAGLHDPEIPVTTHLVHTLTRLKTLLTYGVREKPAKITWFVQAPEHPRAAEIRNSYIDEIAAGLSKRTGGSQTTTAMTILTYLPKDTQSSSATLREVRRILLQQFDAMHPHSQDWLLRQHWDVVRDPALIPALKKLVGAPHTRQMALKGLLELAPDEARSYVLAEIRDPNSLVDAELLSKLTVETLPELESTLVDQIRKLTALSQNRDAVFLKAKTALLVRYATENVYQDVLQLYGEVGTKLPLGGRAGLLAYLTKHNERDAIPLIEQALAELRPGQSPQLLSDITRLYYSEALGLLLKKLLETDDAAKSSHAAYLIGLHGAASDQQVLEARLKRWQEHWRDRVAEADAQHQGKTERELIFALINGKSWKLSPERVNQLKMSCLTELCKRSNLVRQDTTR